MNEDLRALAAQQGGAFTVAQARRSGIGKRQFSALVRTEAVTRLRRGIYVESALLADPHSRAVADIGAAQLCVDRDTWVSQASALVLHGVELLDLPGSVSLTSEDGTSVSHEGLIVHSAGVPPAHRAAIPPHGLPTLSAPRALVDHARAAPFVAGVVAADSALKRGKTNKKALRSVVDHPRLVRRA